MRKLFIPIAALFAAAALVAPALAQVATVPYRIDYEGWYTVPVTVNGEGPFDFIIDTGATATVVFRNLADRQGMQLTDKPPRRILGLVGAERLPVYAIGDLEIGGQTLLRHDSPVIEDWAADRATPQGVLGLDFLARYSIVFDARQRTISFYSPETAPPEKIPKWRRAALKGDDFGQGAGEIYRLTAWLEGHPIPFILDLGASGTIVNYAALRKLVSGVRINETRETGFSTGTRLNDIFDETEKARLVRIGSVRVGSARWRKRTYVVYNAPIFAELGVDRQPMGFFGSDNFIGRSFIIDFPNREILVGPEIDPS